MKNLDIYDKSRSVPKDAVKPIEGGRMKGMSSINSMWRIKKLTELFGPVGIGWTYETTEKWLYESPTGEIVQFVKIALYVKHEGEWSRPIEGVGGAMLVSIERNGQYTDDEALKKATTDALSVACKLLGIGADIYYTEDRSKYNTAAAKQEPPQPAYVDPETLMTLKRELARVEGNMEVVLKTAGADTPEKIPQALAEKYIAKLKKEPSKDGLPFG